MRDNAEEIEVKRTEAKAWDRSMKEYAYDYQLQDDSTFIQFKGFKHGYPTSEVSGSKRLKYYRDEPWAKNVPYFNHYEAQKSAEIPEAFVIGGQCEDVIARLKANNVVLNPIEPGKLQVEQYRVISFKNGEKPYDGHYLHRQIESELTDEVWDQKPTDFVVPMNQPNRRFIMSVLTPDSPDSYFAWNFFDSYVQQKEYFSAYVFEDKAAEILNNDPELKKKLEAEKENNPSFKESTWNQLYFVYRNSPYYEPTHNVLPLGRSK